MAIPLCLLPTDARVKHAPDGGHEKGEAAAGSLAEKRAMGREC
jgi:hypothetical protein